MMNDEFKIEILFEINYEPIHCKFYNPSNS